MNCKAFNEYNTIVTSMIIIIWTGLELDASDAAEGP